MIQSGLHLKRSILIAGDIAVFLLSLAVTLAIRYGSIVQHWGDHAWPFSILILLWITGFYIVGLYDLSLAREPMRFLRTYLEAMLANLATAVAFFYLLPTFGIAPRTNLFLYFAVAILLGYGWRLVFTSTIAERFPRGRVLYIGPAEEAAQVHALLRSSNLGLDLVAAIPTSGAPDPTVHVAWDTNLSKMETIVHTFSIQTIVLGANVSTLPSVTRVLYQSLSLPIAVLDRAEIEEITTGRIPLDHVTESWFLRHLRESEKTWYEGFKRTLDVTLAIPFGMLAIILLPMIAFAIKVSSAGPILYRQKRVGRAGRLIGIVKFRTMRMDAEAHGPQFTASTKDDPRVTSVGRFLRQLRMDELPQVWNVLRGDLSFVGPRPERPEFVAPLVERMPYYALRHLTRPGLTGWAQVRFLTPTASLEDNLKKLQYDLFYIKHRSLLLDLSILLKTIGIVLRRQGT